MDTDAEPEVSRESIREVSFMADFCEELLLAAGVDSKEKIMPKAEQLVAQLKSSLLPFLRCSAILYHFLTNVSPPSKLKDSAAALLSQQEEFAVLCQYLGLPSHFHLIIESSSLRQLALSWTRHPRIHLLISSRDAKTKSPTDLPLKLIPQPHTVNQLVVLPNDYSELINSVSQFTCPNSDSEDSRSPTMCLVCGAMLCSQSYCCQTDLEPGQMVGACTFHTHQCGAGVGIFLRIRDCKILLLAGKSKGAFFCNECLIEKI